MFKAHLEFSLIRYAKCAVVVVIIVVTCHSIVDCCFGCVVVYTDFCGRFMYVCLSIINYLERSFQQSNLFIFSPIDPFHRLKKAEIRK